MDKHLKVAPVRKEMMTNPFFPVKSTDTAVRTFETPNGTWHLGIKHASVGNVEYAKHTMTIEHAEVFFAILSFLDRSYTTIAPQEDEAGIRVNFSLNDLVKKLGKPRSAQNYRKIENLVKELEYFWNAITLPDGNVIQFKPVMIASITASGTSKKKSTKAHVGEELMFDSITISKQYIELIKDLKKVVYLDTTSLHQISSKIGKAIFTYLPSRAIHRDESNPFKISLKTLLKQVNALNTSTKYPAGRKQVFCRRQVKTSKKTGITKECLSVIDQLDGLDLQNGMKFRCRVTDELNRAGDDYLFLAWVDKPIKKVYKPKTSTEKWLKENLDFTPVMWAELCDAINQKQWDMDSWEYSQFCGYIKSDQDEWFFSLYYSLIAVFQNKEFIWNDYLSSQAGMDVDDPLAVLTAGFRRILLGQDPLKNLKIEQEKHK